MKRLWFGGLQALHQPYFQLSLTKQPLRWELEVKPLKGYFTFLALLVQMSTSMCRVEAKSVHTTLLFNHASLW